MPDNCKKELFVVSFPGKGYGGYDALKRCLKVDLCELVDLELKMLKMLADTEMMVVKRDDRADAQNGVLGGGTPSLTKITLQLDGTQKFRDLFYRYLTGKEPIDKQIWSFLVKGGYISHEHESVAPQRASVGSAPTSLRELYDSLGIPSSPDSSASGTPSALRYVYPEAHRYSYTPYPIPLIPPPPPPPPPPYISSYSLSYQ